MGLIQPRSRVVGRRATPAGWSDKLLKCANRLETQAIEVPIYLISIISIPSIGKFPHELFTNSYNEFMSNAHNQGFPFLIELPSVSTRWQRKRYDFEL